MNIESIQTANPQQRTATPNAPTQVARQERVAASQSVAPKNAQAEDGQKQFSVQEAVKHLTDFVSLTNADISFSVDEASGVQVVKITDGQTKEVIRQFPSEEAIRIAQALDQLQGVFVRDKA